jgi:hypothetical protein
MSDFKPSSPGVNFFEFKKFALKMTLLAGGFLVLDSTFNVFRQAPHPVELNSIKHEEMLEERLEEGIRMPVVFIGSSMTQSAINPAYSKESQKLWNAGIATKSNIWWQSDLIQELVDRNQTTHIVYGIETFSFGSAPTSGRQGKDKFVAPFLKSFQNRDGFKTWLTQSVKQRRPAKLPLFQEKPMPLPPDRTVNCCRQELEPSGWLNMFDTTANPSWIHGGSLRFSPSPGESKRLLEALRYAKSKGAVVDFVILPNFLEYGDEKSKERQVASTNVLVHYLQDLVSSVGNGRVIDGRRYNPIFEKNHTLYYDSVHLNGRGASVFSRYLFDDLGL